MKAREILLEYENYIPQPSTLQVKTSSYEFIQLMKEYRSEQKTRSTGDQGLVMFYSEEEKADFAQYLTSRGVAFTDIGSR